MNGALRVRGGAFLVGAIALWAGARVMACASGLTLIPSADVVPARNWSVEFQVDGTLRGGSLDTYILNTEFGLWNRFEAGVDFDLSEGAEDRVLLNAKVVLAAAKDGKWALAAGFGESGEVRFKADPYLVFVRDLGAVRLHGGALRTGGAVRGFCGLDGPIGERFWWMVDHTVGRENESSAGGYWQMHPQVGLLAAAIFPNAGGPARFTVHLVLSGPFRGAAH